MRGKGKVYTREEAHELRMDRLKEVLGTELYDKAYAKGFFEALKLVDEHCKDILKKSEVEK